MTVEEYAEALRASAEESKAAFIRAGMMDLMDGRSWASKDQPEGPRPETLARAAIVIPLKERGMSPRQIALETGLSVGQVDHIIREIWKR